MRRILLCFNLCSNSNFLSRFYICSSRVRCASAWIFELKKKTFRRFSVSTWTSGGFSSGSKSKKKLEFSYWYRKRIFFFTFFTSMQFFHSLFFSFLSVRDPNKWFSFPQMWNLIYILKFQRLNSEYESEYLIYSRSKSKSMELNSAVVYEKAMKNCSLHTWWIGKLFQTKEQRNRSKYYWKSLAPGITFYWLKLAIFFVNLFSLTQIWFSFVIANSTKKKCWSAQNICTCM